MLAQVFEPVNLRKKRVPSLPKDTMHADEIPRRRRTYGRKSLNCREKIELLFCYPTACFSEGWWDYWHREKKVQQGAFLLSGRGKRCFTLWGFIQKPQAELAELEKLYFLTSGSDTSAGCWWGAKRVPLCSLGQVQALSIPCCRWCWRSHYSAVTLPVP